MTKARVFRSCISLILSDCKYCCFQLIRTTYRTRFDQRKRKDDDQPMRAEELELMMAAQRKAIANEIGNVYNASLWKQNT
jgi:hypothetical protein